MVTAVGNGAAVVQAGLVQLKVQQAQRQADRAEDAARVLSQQAARARNDADRAVAVAQRLGIESDRASSAAGQARQGLAALRTATQAADRLSRAFDRVAGGATGATARQGDATPTVPAAPAPAAATASVGPGTQINSQGQTTGRLVDVAA